MTSHCIRSKSYSSNLALAAHLAFVVWHLPLHFIFSHPPLVFLLPALLSFLKCINARMTFSPGFSRLSSFWNCLPPFIPSSIPPLLASPLGQVDHSPVHHLEHQCFHHHWDFTSLVKSNFQLLPTTQSPLCIPSIYHFVVRCLRNAIGRKKRRKEEASLG